jgi:hypothetical protein
MIGGKVAKEDQNGRAPQANDSEKQKPKKSYKKPSFRFESVFETMALSCGKIIPSQAGCKLNRKNS